MILKLSGLAVFSASLFCTGASAQGGSTLAGVVLNSQLSPVAGAVVTVDGSGLRLERRTGESGRFVFQPLPVGTYRVEATAPMGTAFATVDLSMNGSTVTLRLLRTVVSTRSGSSTNVRGSGTDVVLNQTAIEHSPAYASLPDLLLQLPGAARGANGVVHINGDHGDINYVVDGVPMPEALNREIGTEIDPSDIAFMDVLEGAYPAQYGGRFAAVVNIETKAAQGPAGINGYVSAGSFAAYDSELEYHAPLGKGSIEIGSRQERSARALDPPEFNAGHNNGSDANQFLRYAVPVHGSDFLIASAIQSLQTFQIPGNADDNETQADTFANLQYHHAGRANGALVYGVAFKRSRIRDFNDPVNDLADGAYTLFSDRTSRDVLLNLDASVTGPRHALKYGASYDASTVQKLYSVTVEPESVYPVAPATVVDNAPNAAHTQAAYVQDSWAMGHDWRLDYGLRADAYELFSTQFVRGFSQVSPRLKITRIYGTRASAYVYAGRFFTPFSSENVSPSAAQELNSQLQPTIAQFDLKPQRDTDVEIGGILPVGAGQLGLRVMQKAAVDLIDDTQVGDTALHQDINYARGNISSQSALYQQTFRHDGRLYVSLTHTRSVNKGCETQLLAPCFGAPQDWTPADHDQKWDGAAGMSLTDAHSGWWSFDAEYGSGLSSAYCEPANDDCKVPPHTTFDVERGIGLNHGLTLTAGVYNVLNDRYLITYLNAQGNHYAAGRTFRVGLRFGER